MANDLTTTAKTDILESLRDLDLGKYKKSAINQYLNFMQATGSTLDTGLVPYVKALKADGWIDRQGKKRKYKAKSIIARLAAATALGAHILDKHPRMLTPAQYVAYDKAKKKAVKACPKTVKGLDDSKWMPWAEVKALIHGTDEIHLKLIMKVLAATGARISEVLNIEIEDMSRNSTEYHIQVLGKGDTYRDAPVKIRLIEECFKVFAGERYLFEHDGKKYNAQSITTRIGDTAEKVIGRRVSAHAFRHSYATEQQEQHVPLSQISLHLGHSSISTTADIYGHKRMSAKTAMLDVDEPDAAEDKIVTDKLDQALGGAPPATDKPGPSTGYGRSRTGSPAAADLGAAIAAGLKLKEGKK